MWWWLACGVAEVAGNPLASSERVSLSGEGVVVEVVSAGSYTYLRLDDAPERWLVALGDAPEIGEVLSFRAYARTTDFRSRRLGRRFDELFFASIDASEER